MSTLHAAQQIWLTVPPTLVKLAQIQGFAAQPLCMVLGKLDVQYHQLCVKSAQIQGFAAWCSASLMHGITNHV